MKAQSLQATSRHKQPLAPCAQSNRRKTSPTSWATPRESPNPMKPGGSTQVLKKQRLALTIDSRAILAPPQSPEQQFATRFSTVAVITKYVGDALADSRDPVAYRDRGRQATRRLIRRGKTDHPRLAGPRLSPGANRQCKPRNRNSPTKNGLASPLELPATPAVGVTPQRSGTATFDRFGLRYTLGEWGASEIR